MRKIGKIIIISALLLSLIPISYASDWDKAGKILTGIEGLRIITGGKVDIVGSIAGLNFHSDKEESFKLRQYAHRRKHPHPKRIWVPYYTWKKVYVPEHVEYHPKYGKVVVEGHYIKYKVEDGGYWAFSSRKRRSRYYPFYR